MVRLRNLLTLLFISLAASAQAAVVPFGSQQVISTAGNVARSVFAADVDGDGDLDVLAASWSDDEVAWYENTDGAGSFGGQQVITTAVNGALSVFAGDLDRDGDLDVLEGGTSIAWYENRGGQFALETADNAPLLILQGESSDLLEIVMTHRGRAGDSDAELASLELLFEEAPGDPLSSAEANALIETLAVYRDDGSGVFEAGSDMLVGSVGTLSLTDGIQTLPLTDGHAGAQVVYGTPGTFFVVVTLTADARSQTPYRFRVTHVTESTESSGTAEYPETDSPLVLEYAPDVSSRVVLAMSLTSDEDGDGLFDIAETNTGVYVSPTDTGTHPFDPDMDGDRLRDGFEDDTGVYVSPTQTGTDPNVWDTDGDVAGDGWEVLRGTDPNDPADTPPPSLPALGPWGYALLLLVLAGAGASRLRLRRRRG